MNKAKKMLLAGFLACTMLATSAALTACGDTSDSSPETSSPETSSPETSSPEAWELENATVVYTVDKNGVETANYTVVGKNGEEYTKSVATGRTVVEVDMDSVKVNGEALEEAIIETTVGNEPKVEILATFNDGSSDWVTITDDMYVGAKPDYTKAGIYTAQIKLIERLSAPVLVQGDKPVTVETYFLNEDMGGMCVLWNKADVVAGTYDVSTVLWGYVTTFNGEESQVVANATADQIKPIDWTAESEEGIYSFSVTNANGESGVLQAYVMDENSETEVLVAARQLGSFNMMSSLTALKGSDVADIDTSDMIAVEMMMIGTGAMGMRVSEIPEAAVYTLDTSVCGEQELTATWTEGEETITATTSVLVYETINEYAELTYAYVNSYKAVESGVIDMELQIYSYTEYKGDDQVLMTTNYNNETVALTADMIKGTAPDFTTAGVKVFTIEVGGEEYTYAVEVWAEEEKAVATTTNVASLNLPKEITLVKDEMNIELYVRQYFVGVETDVYYIEAVNGSMYDSVKLKASAFDWSAVKMDTVGQYALKVSYEGYEQTITVNVVAEMPEPEEVTLVALLQVEMGAVSGYDFYAIELYSDYSAVITDGNPMFGYYDTIYATYELDETTGKLMLTWERWGSIELAMLQILDTDEDGAYDYAMPFSFGEPIAEYSIIYFGEEQTLKLYEEGFGELVSSWGYVTFSGTYTLENGLLTIAGNKFYVQGTGADVTVLEVLSGNY